MKLYIPAVLLLFTVFSCALPADSQPDKITAEEGTEKVVFKSTDGGQSWQDISKGLPVNLQKEGIRGDSIFATDKGLFLKLSQDHEFRCINDDGGKKISCKS